jgi:translation initiation factor 2 beta subunit (eIF-2beta)/eIF-5
MKTVSARLDIEVFVDCPHCDSLIDLLNPDDTDGHNHNEESYVIAQACPDGAWIDEHKKFDVENVTCSECKKDFNVKGLDW